MNNLGAYSKLHPALIVFTVACGIFLAMCLQRLTFQVLGAVGTALVVYSTNPKGSLKIILGMLPVIVLIAVINPLFNTSGSEILFTYLNGRPYTYESLVLGFGTGLMFVTLIWWFSFFNACMTTDKITYILSGFIPSASTVLTMIFRFVPWFSRHYDECVHARKCIGKGPSEGDVKTKAANATDIFSGITSWALEGAAVTSDSMTSRGFGTSKRTHYLSYSFKVRDYVVGICIVIFFLLVTIFFLIANQSEFHSIYLYKIAIICYSCFLLTPSVFNCFEGLSWVYFRSKI